MRLKQAIFSRIFVSKNGLNMRHLAEITPYELVADLGTRVPKFEKFRFIERADERSPMR